MDEVFKARTLRVIDLYDLLVIEDQNPSVFDGKLGAYEIKRVFWTAHFRPWLHNPVCGLLEKYGFDQVRVASSNHCGNKGRSCLSQPFICGKHVPLCQDPDF